MVMQTCSDIVKVIGRFPGGNGYVITNEFNGKIHLTVFPGVSDKTGFDLPSIFFIFKNSDNVADIVRSVWVKISETDNVPNSLKNLAKGKLK